MKLAMVSSSDNFHELSGNWVLWAHFPHDTNWAIDSYKVVAKMSTVEDIVAISATLPDILVRNCMLFMMREGVHPTWEDKSNRNGGFFSYKTQNKDVPDAWRQLMYSVAGESVSKKLDLCEAVTGITISPKRNFCVIKIWMTNCEHQMPRDIIEMPGLNWRGCLFKKQTPQYA